MSFARTDNSALARWWWTIDRVTFACVFALIAIGLVLACAASPAATGSADAAGDFRYALKQVAFAAAAGTILFGASLLDPRNIRILAAALFGLALIGAGAALFGTAINGAHRWLEIASVRFEPSEFLKPAFAVLAATFLADRIKRGFPGEAVTLALLAPAVAILLLQPDIGQTALLVVIGVTILFFAGLSHYWLVVLGGGAAALAGITYLQFPHVRERLAQFFESGTGYQTSLARKAFESGGVTGVGPGEGNVKYRLPDAHTDFIYAVAGEEFGLILCALIAALFGVITVRLLLRASKAQDPFVQLAGAGLAVAIGFQAFINMGVALSLLPAKGMTLPLISYGGSSLFAVALTLGLALAITRQRPHLPEYAR
jgi:cell division protein FtsW